MPNIPLLEKNQKKITKLHNKISEIYEEINAIRRQDVIERREMREQKRLPERVIQDIKNIKQNSIREENHFGERLYARWEKWEIDLIKRYVNPKEIARVTGRSLIAVDAKMHKLKHKLNYKEHI